MTQMSADENQRKIKSRTRCHECRHCIGVALSAFICVICGLKTCDPTDNHRDERGRRLMIPDKHLNTSKNSKPVKRDFETSIDVNGIERFEANKSADDAEVRR